MSSNTRSSPTAAILGADCDRRLLHSTSVACRSFPVFLRERTDLTWDDVVRARSRARATDSCSPRVRAQCKNAKTNMPFSQIKKIVPPLLQKQHSIMFSAVPSRTKSGSLAALQALPLTIHFPPGDKIITDDDVDEDLDGVKPSLVSFAKCRAVLRAAKSDGSKKGKKSDKEPCKYGLACFRTGADHLAVREHMLCAARTHHR